MRFLKFWFPLFLCVFFHAPSAHSQGTPSPPAHGEKWAKVVSREGTAIYLGLGMALPLLEDKGRLGRSRSERTLAALGATYVLTEGLKRLTREPRPDRSDNKSFPSGHASLAFALATTRAEYKPKQAPYWYAGAALISASRVNLKKHYVRDVLAGAALGHFTARYVLNHWHDPKSSATVSLSSPADVALRVRF